MEAEACARDSSNGNSGSAIHGLGVLFGIVVGGYMRYAQFCERVANVVQPVLEGFAEGGQRGLAMTSADQIRFEPGINTAQISSTGLVERAETSPEQNREQVIARPRPTDAIRLSVAASRYEVTTRTIQRAIADDGMPSWKPPAGAKNARLWVLEKDVAARWPKRPATK